MLRIDEIYTNTFWPWFNSHRPGHRIQFCDPFGRSDPDSVLNYGREDIPEHNYTLFFDQEPIDLNLHDATFHKVKHVMNLDLNQNFPGCGSLVTSEFNSQQVDQVCARYNWRQYYYFFHGWAALDWFRGYDKTFLIDPWHTRYPTKTFIAPNRIIAGARQHRLEILYWIFKFGLLDNYISCPLICPAENVSVFDAVRSLSNRLPDCESVFRSATLPLQFKNETDHPMHSCWLSLFDQCHDSLLYVVTETVANGRRNHLTEKTFKPIAHGMPFVVVSTAHSLSYLKQYGFETFSPLIDESYDNELDDHARIKKIAEVLRDLDRMSVSQRQMLYHACIPVIEHNWNHFYNGGFEKILWQELQEMLATLDAESGI